MAQQFKEMGETAINLAKKEKRLDPKANLEIMKPVYGVHIKDYFDETAKDQSDKLDVDGGLFDENPDLKGKKMSKNNYNQSKKVGLQPGYLEKVESQMR